MPKETYERAVIATQNVSSGLSGGLSDPAAYHAWYETPRGAWIAERELDLMLSLLRPQPAKRPLDVGCGTGWFSNRFADTGLSVIGLDPNALDLRFAQQQDGRMATDPGQLNVRVGSSPVIN